MHTTLKAALSGVFYGLIALIVGYLGLMTLADPRFPGPYKGFIVRSGSMEPTIMTGDLVLVDTSQTNYKIGDVVTFNSPSHGIVTHRIINAANQAGSSLFTTKGDNNEDQDNDQINSSSIIGLWRWRIPYAGYFLVFGRSIFTLGILIALCGSVWVVQEYLLADPSRPKARPATA